MLVTLEHLKNLEHLPNYPKYEAHLKSLIGTQDFISIRDILEASSLGYACLYLEALGDQYEQEVMLFSGSLVALVKDKLEAEASKTSLEVALRYADALANSKQLKVAQVDAAQAISQASDRQAKCAAKAAYWATADRPHPSAVLHWVTQAGLSLADAKAELLRLLDCVDTRKPFNVVL